MKVFVTGATGFIGSALVPELIQAGHTVVGMTRSEKGAQALAKAGAEVHYGTLEDIASLKAGASQADAVIHLAFNHDFSKIQANCEEDRRAIEAMGEALAGSGRPFLGTAGVLVDNLTTGKPLDEDDTKPASQFPRVSEEATLATVEKGVRGIVMRLSQIHDTHQQGLVSFLIQLALAEKGSGLCWRWQQPLGGGARQRHRAALSAGSGKGRGRFQVARGWRAGRDGQGHCRSARETFEPAGGFDFSGRGSCALRFPRSFHGARLADIEHEDPRAAGLGADGTLADRRSQSTRFAGRSLTQSADGRGCPNESHAAVRAGVPQNEPQKKGTTSQGKKL